MQKIHQPESAGKAQDLHVEPMTAEEIQQVSGGVGMNRSNFVTIQSNSRAGVSARQTAPVAGGRTVHFSS